MQHMVEMSSQYVVLCMIRNTNCFTSACWPAACNQACLNNTFSALNPSTHPRWQQPVCGSDIYQVICTHVIGIGLKKLYEGSNLRAVPHPPSIPLGKFFHTRPGANYQLIFIVPVPSSSLQPESEYPVHENSVKGCQSACAAPPQARSRIS